MKSRREILELGVAAMGILRIDFIWYLRKMMLPALLGYLGGILTFWLMWGSGGH